MLLPTPAAPRRASGSGRSVIEDLADRVPLVPDIVALDALRLLAGLEAESLTPAVDQNRYPRDSAEERLEVELVTPREQGLRLRVAVTGDEETVLPLELADLPTHHAPVDAIELDVRQPLGKTEQERQQGIHVRAGGSRSEIRDDRALHEGRSFAQRVSCHYSFGRSASRTSSLVSGIGSFLRAQ